MSEWWFDERSHAGEEHFDAAYVAGYDEKAGFDPTDDVEVLLRHGLNRDSIVIDMGAGTGEFSAAVAPLCREVVAVDISPAMTAALRSRIRGDGLDNVTVIEDGFLSFQLGMATVDFVYSRNALHHVPDFWKAIALQRFAVMLRPAGVLRLRDLAFNFEPGEADGVIEAWLAGAVSDSTKGFTGEELAHHVRTEFSTYSWLLEEMIARAGFTILDREYQRSAYGTYTCRCAE